MKEQIYEISVIIPAYNSADTIEKCIASIIQQKYQNFEIIIVNDGSTDDTLQIINAIDDERIRVYSKNNSGAADARNLGIEKARGKYITFIDADDWVDSNYLYQLHHTAEQYHSDITICNLYEVWGMNYIVPQENSGKGIWIMDGPDIDIYQRKFLCKGIKEYEPYVKCGYSYAKLFNSELIQTHHIRFPQKMKYGEDGIFNLYAAQYAHRIVYLDDAYYYYRIAGDSVCHGYTHNIIEYNERDFYEVKKFIDKYKHSEPFYKDAMYVRIATATSSYLQRYYFTRQYITDHSYRMARQQFLKIVNHGIYKTAIRHARTDYMNKNQKLYITLLRANMLDVIYLIFKVLHRI